MPFTERDGSRPDNFFSEVLNRLITPAVVSAGFRAVTADRRGSDVIHSTIVNSLLDADLVVADLTDHNPNVLFELGMRMHADKPIALIQADGTARIFDVDNVLRVLAYNPNLWTSTLEIDRPKLTEHVKAAWDNRQSDETYFRLLRRKKVPPGEQ
jgi:nucleoside 2-deoxyribosyltransferase